MQAPYRACRRWSVTGLLALAGMGAAWAECASPSVICQASPTLPGKTVAETAPLAQVNDATPSGWHLTAESETPPSPFNRNLRQSLRPALQIDKNTRLSMRLKKNSAELRVRITF